MFLCPTQAELFAEGLESRVSKVGEEMQCQSQSAQGFAVAAEREAPRDSWRLYRIRGASVRPLVVGGCDSDECVALRHPATTPIAQLAGEIAVLLIVTGDAVILRLPAAMFEIRPVDVVEGSTRTGLFIVGAPGPLGWRPEDEVKTGVCSVPFDCPEAKVALDEAKVPLNEWAACS